MDNEFHTFEEVSKLDTQLFKLATYEVTGGMMIAPSNMEEMMEIQKRSVSQFNYFKKLIHNNEATLEQLTQQILAKNGPFPRKSLEVNESNIDEIIEGTDKSCKYFEEIEAKTEEQKTLQSASQFLLSLALGGKPHTDHMNNDNGPDLSMFTDFDMGPPDIENSEDIDIDEE